jgi:hypothetical protein
MTASVASGRSEFAGWGLHPLESAAFARRTSEEEVRNIGICGRNPFKTGIIKPNLSCPKCGNPNLEATKKLINEGQKFLAHML